jgi:hypothetical protein
MTDAASSPDRTMQMLDLLAEMDLTAAQHAHAQLLAATEPKAVTELARAYQRTQPLPALGADAEDAARRRCGGRRPDGRG